MTLKVRIIVEAGWEFPEKPAYGWVWPAPTQCGHVNHASLKKRHARAFRQANSEINAKAEKEKKKPVLLKPRVQYSFRHMFLTRLGESGCDAWSIARIAGQSSIAISIATFTLQGLRKAGGEKSRVSTLRKEVNHLKRVLAEKTLEVDFFRGALQKVEARRQSNNRSGEKASTTKFGK